MYDVFIHKHCIYLVMEYAYTDLYKLSLDNAKPLTNGQIKWILKSLLEAVTFIHSKLILHRVIFVCD